MVFENKCNEALHFILNNLSETNDPDVDTTAIEAENAQLRFKQRQLIAKLNIYPTVNSSSLLAKDMLSRQRIINRIRSKTKEQLAIHTKARLDEAAVQTETRKQNLQEVHKFMTLVHPSNEVNKKVLKMEKKLEENRSKIKELIPVWEKLSLMDKNKEDDILKLSNTLKCCEKAQRNLLAKYKQK